MLTALLTLGASAMFLARVTEYVHLFDVLDDAAIKKAFGTAKGTPRPMAIIVTQYLFALAITANNIEQSLRLGSRSVLSWSCRFWWTPMVWVLFSMSTYAFAATSCCITRQKTQHADSTCLYRWIRCDPIEDALSSCVRFLQACSRLLYLGSNRVPPVRVMLWQVGASFLALAHAMLGTLILSSLIFVGFHDTLIILARFLGSSLISRNIVLLQLDSIRAQFDQALIIDDVGGRYGNNSRAVALYLEPIAGLNDSGTV